MRPTRLLLLSSLTLFVAGCAEAPRAFEQVTDTAALTVTIEVPADYPTIQDAIWAAGPEDVIQVGAGTWTEDLTLPGSLALVGAGRGVTIIEGTVDIIAGQAAVIGVTVQGPGLAASDGCGVSVGADNSIILNDSWVTGFDAGLCIDSGDGPLSWDWAKVDRTFITGNGYGVLLHSGEVDITNSFVGWNGLAGVWAYEGFARAGIVNNTFVNNAYSTVLYDRGAALSLGSDSEASVVRNNSFSLNSTAWYCDGCGATADYNHFWDNGADYGGDASAQPSDLNADPGFVSLEGGAWYLLEDSPLIDAGSPDGAPEIDFEGHARPGGAGIDIGADEWPAPPSEPEPEPEPVPELSLVLSEVMANPLVESTGEFVELINDGNVEVDLAGFLVSDGDSVDVIEAWDDGSTVVPVGGVAVIVDPGYQGHYDLPASATVVTVSTAALGNGLSTSDPVTLMDADGVELDAWTSPFNPGNGTSVERSWDLPDQWEASLCDSGSSPGTDGCAPGDEPAESPDALLVSEVMSNPLSEATGEFVELYNDGDGPVDLAGLVLDDGDAQDVIQAFEGGSTVVPAGAYAVIVDRGYAGQYDLPADVTVVTVDDNALGTGLAASSDPVTLLHADGVTVIDGYSFPFNAGNGTSVERAVLEDGDVEGNWVASGCGHSAGLPNCE